MDVDAAGPASPRPCRRGLSCCWVPGPQRRPASGADMSAEQQLTPEFRAWLEQETLRGRRLIHAINRQQRLLPTDSRGLGRFAIRMALVDLTGAAARWSRVLQHALLDACLPEAADAFASPRPLRRRTPGRRIASAFLTGCRRERPCSTGCSPARSGRAMSSARQIFTKLLISTGILELRCWRSATSNGRDAGRAAGAGGLEGWPQPSRSGHDALRGRRDHSAAAASLARGTAPELSAHGHRLTWTAVQGQSTYRLLSRSGEANRVQILSGRSATPRRSRG